MAIGWEESLLPLEGFGAGDVFLEFLYTEFAYGPPKPLLPQELSEIFGYTFGLLE